MEFVASSSVETVHGVRPWPPIEGEASTSSSRCHHYSAHQLDRIHERDDGTPPSPPSSPRSGALPSPPDSPSLDSLSSFPSVGSSFFFSSGAASPHTHTHSHPGSYTHSEHYTDSEPEGSLGAPLEGLIIPSLTLPATLQTPTPFGQTLGEVNLLIVGPQGAGKTDLAQYIVDAEDVVDVTAWEDLPRYDDIAAHGGDTTVKPSPGRVLHASTDWIEERDAHGLERFEGTKNVTVVELNGFRPSEGPEDVIDSIRKHVRRSFQDVETQLSASPSSPLLQSLLCSSHTTLYTALVYAAPYPLTTRDQIIISALSSLIPVIPLSMPSHSASIPYVYHAQIHSTTHLTDEVDGTLASFLPRTASALRAGLFRAPQTLAGLRSDAADRFLRWREVELAYNDKITADSRTSLTSTHWDKAEWEASLSEDYARRLIQESESKANKPLSPTSVYSQGKFQFKKPCFAPLLDPLHFRSVATLLTRAARSSRPSRKKAKPSNSGEGDRLRWRQWTWGIALMGVFCAGLGIGIGIALSGST